MVRHPEHDAVAREVRSWYTAPTPAIGLAITPTSYGFLTSSDRAERQRLVLTDDSSERVADILASTIQFYGSSDFEVWVDDRSRAERLAASLATAGMQPFRDTVVLALVGSVRPDRALPEGLSIHDVLDEGGLQAWAAAKLQGFASNEKPPAAYHLDAELAERRAEWPVCRYQVARIAGEVVATLGHYTGRDQMVFSLATRLPFRHRGIAQSMLVRWSEEGAAPQVRSRLINCDAGGAADDLYRRLGFTDEVYWYRRYRYAPPSGNEPTGGGRRDRPG